MNVVYSSSFIPLIEGIRLAPARVLVLVLPLAVAVVVAVNVDVDVDVENDVEVWVNIPEGEAGRNRFGI